MVRIGDVPKRQTVELPGGRRPSPADRRLWIVEESHSVTIRLPPSDVVIHPGKRPEPVLVDSASHRVYVGTETGGSVVMIDDSSNKVVGRVHVGSEVEDLALDPSEGRIYAVSSVVGKLTSISTHRVRVRSRLGRLDRPVAPSTRFPR